MTSQDDLTLLKQMHQRGEITDEQYDALRRHVLWGTPLPQLLDETPGAAGGPAPPPRHGPAPVDPPAGARGGDPWSRSAAPSAPEPGRPDPPTRYGTPRPDPQPGPPWSGRTSGPPADPVSGHPLPGPATPTDPLSRYAAPADPLSGYAAPPDPLSGYTAPPDPLSGYATQPDPLSGYAAPPDPLSGYAAPPDPPGDRPAAGTRRARREAAEAGYSPSAYRPTVGPADRLAGGPWSSRDREPSGDQVRDEPRGPGRPGTPWEPGRPGAPWGPGEPDRPGAGRGLGEPARPGAPWDSGEPDRPGAGRGLAEPDRWGGGREFAEPDQSGGERGLAEPGRWGGERGPAEPEWWDGEPGRSAAGPATGEPVTYRPPTERSGARRAAANRAADGRAGPDRREQAAPDDGTDDDRSGATRARSGTRRPRRRSLLAVLTSLVLALALTAAGVYWFVLREEGVRPADYARAVCGSVRDWQQAVDSGGAALVTRIAREEDRTVVRSAVATYYADLAGRTDQLRTAVLVAGVADVSGGRAYADSLAAAVGDQATVLRNLSARARRLDPAAAGTFSVQLQSLLTGSETAVGVISAALARPSAGTPAPLRAALGAEPSCAPYVG